MTPAPFLPFAVALALVTLAPTASAFEVRAEIVPITRTVHAEVQTDERPVARARIVGLVAELEVDEGDRVERGQVIARIEDPELASRLAAAEAEVGRAEVRSRIAARDLQRQRALFEEDDVSRARLDEAIRRADEAEQAVEAARSQAQTLRERRARGDVLAPGDGPVIEVRVEQGSAVRPGAAVARVATAPSVVRIRVPERHLDHLRGAEAIRIATPEGPVHAELRLIYPDVVGGRIQADLVLPEGVEPAPVGRRLAVKLQVDQREQLLVPRDLVEERAGLAFVRRADGGRTLVQLGRDVGERVVVLSGLRAGDRLTPP